MGPLALTAWLFDREKGEAFTTGVFSHLFLDSFTSMGLPLFYPLISTYYSLYFYSTTNLNWIIIVVSAVLIINAKKLFKKEASKKILAGISVVWIVLLAFSKV
jgi:membrane-bound metal-dependent hydrolase YbcI (DUF457 family)